MHIHFKDHMMMNAPATKVWRVLAHEFGTIGHWASAIPASQGLPETPAPPGAEVGARVCSTAVPGFGQIRETLTSYDERAMRFAYEATEGRPWFIKHAENHWMVRSLGPSTSEVEARAEVEVSWFPGVFLAPLMKLQLGRVGAQTFEELKYYVERDQVHPRKLKAQQKHGQKARTRS
jgi:hypothetical protein